MQSISPALPRPCRGYAGYPNQSKSTPKELNYWTSEEVCPLPEVRFPRKSSRIEALNRIDLFAQSQRDCAPKPKVAERARLPWVLAPTTPATPTGGCALPFFETLTNKPRFMESSLFHSDLLTGHEPESVGVPEDKEIMTICRSRLPLPSTGRGAGVRGEIAGNKHPFLPVHGGDDLLRPHAGNLTALSSFVPARNR
jgi:hypothetical protein